MSASLRGDQQVVMANWRAGALKLRTNRAGVLGIGEMNGSGSTSSVSKERSAASLRSRRALFS